MLICKECRCYHPVSVSDRYCGECCIGDTRNPIAKNADITGCCLYEPKQTIEAEPDKPKMSEDDSKASEAWCENCDHIEMCKWYPTCGCEFRQIGGKPLHTKEEKKMRVIDYDLLIGKIAVMQLSAEETAYYFLNNAQNPSTEWECIENMIESIPVIETTGEAEPVRHGRWIECDYKHLEHGEIETEPNAGLCCSVCRTGFQKKKMTYKQYCPQCGAKMDALGSEANC